MKYYHPQDPTRPLNWRWMGACQGVPLRKQLKYCDPLMLELARWMHQHGSDPTAWDEPVSPLAGLRQAALFEAAGGVIRDELQAWLLSGLDHEAIASRMGMTPAAIRTYIAVFYDFGAPQAIDGILLRTVRMGDWTYRQPTLAEIWKYLALAGGPYVLELVLADYFGRPEPEYPDRALTAQLLRASVLAYAEGRRSPLEVREVLALAGLWLASTKARGVTPDPMGIVHVELLKRVDAWRNGPSSPRPQPVDRPSTTRPANGAQPDHAHAASPAISPKFWSHS